jgi:two-component system response regulator
MNSQCILLVEDNPNDQELTIRAFKKNNISNEIIIANNGVEALEYLFKTGSHADENSADLPQVVILDLKLPKVNGLEVLKQIRENERTKYLPVVILTSSAEERDIIEGYRLGTNAYVRKPVDFLEFTEAVKQLGLFWLLLNRPCPCGAQHVDHEQIPESAHR